MTLPPPLSLTVHLCLTLALCLSNSPSSLSNSLALSTFFFLAIYKNDKRIRGIFIISMNSLYWNLKPGQTFKTKKKRVKITFNFLKGSNFVFVFIYFIFFFYYKYVQIEKQRSLLLRHFDGGISRQPSINRQTKCHELFYIGPSLAHGIVSIHVCQVWNCKRHTYSTHKKWGGFYRKLCCQKNTTGKQRGMTVANMCLFEEVT